MRGIVEYETLARGGDDCGLRPEEDGMLFARPGFFAGEDEIGAVVGGVEEGVEAEEDVVGVEGVEGVEDAESPERVEGVRWMDEGGRGDSSKPRSLRVPAERDLVCRLAVGRSGDPAL